MNTTTFAEKTTDVETTTIAPESIKVSDDKKKGNDRSSFLIMTSISIIVMLVAVLLIYINIKNNPNVTLANEQVSQVSTNDGFVNPQSIQQLEYDDKNIIVKPVDNSNVFIICGVVMMVVMAGSFVFVKISESKEDN